MTATRRFRDVTRVGPVQVGTAYDNRGREKHTAACARPGGSSRPPVMPCVPRSLMP